MNIQFPFFAGETLRSLADGLNDHFAMLQDKLRRVRETDILPVTSPTTADEPFIVRHNLRAVPKSYGWNADADVRVYATSNDRHEWTKDQIKLRCSAADRRLVIEVRS